MPKKSKKNENLKPNVFAWFIYSIGSRIYMFFRNRIKVDKKAFKKRNKKEGCLVIYNHASNQDHFLATIGFGLTRTAYVVSSHFYYNKKLKRILRLASAISKDQFKPDIGTIKKIKKALQQKLPVTIAPAGQTTMHGGSLFIDKSIVKLIKLCNVDVYAIQICGAYLAYPKWRKFPRKSRIFIKFIKVFNKEELTQLTDEELYEKTIASISVDDRKVIKQLGYKIRSKALVAGLEDMLYLCPKCESMNRIISDKDRLICTNCSNMVKMNQYGRFEGIGDNYIAMDNEEVWYNYEENKIISQIKEKNLHLEGNFYLYLGDSTKYVLNKVGTGKVVLTATELYYEGTLNGNQIKKDFKLNAIHQIPFDVRSHFDIPDDEGYFEFKPTEGQTATIITQFAQAIDAFTKLRNEK